MGALAFCASAADLHLPKLITLQLTCTLCLLVPLLACLPACLPSQRILSTISSCFTILISSSFCRYLSPPFDLYTLPSESRERLSAIRDPLIRLSASSASFIPLPTTICPLLRSTSTFLAFP